MSQSQGRHLIEYRNWAVTEDTLTFIITFLRLVILILFSPLHL